MTWSMLVCREYDGRRCDGLFLTAVSNLGVRFPVSRIVRRLETSCEVRFVVVDGAQDFCHASADLRDEYCDFYLAGCHKWLRAYYLLGLGFYGRRRSQGFIETTLAQLTATGEIDDPLLRFVASLETGSSPGYSETVNLGPLFACLGAVADESAAPDHRPTFLSSAAAEPGHDCSPGCGIRLEAGADRCRTAVGNPPGPRRAAGDAPNGSGDGSSNLPRPWCRIDDLPGRVDSDVDAGGARVRNRNTPAQKVPLQAVGCGSEPLSSGA